MRGFSVSHCETPVSHPASHQMFPCFDSKDSNPSTSQIVRHLELFLHQKILITRFIWHLAKGLSTTQIIKILKISNFVPSFNNFNIDQENLINIGRDARR